jgi:hypothetical protein
MRSDREILNTMSPYDGPFDYYFWAWILEYGDD